MTTPQVSGPVVGAAPAPTTDRSSGGRIVATAAVAAIGSAVAAVVVSFLAKAVGVSHANQLQAGSLAFLTVIGVIAGTVGWIVTCRRAANPEVVLRRLVPAVLLVSWIPDVLVGFGSVTAGAALTLALAHAAVFVVTIPLLRRFLPPASLQPSGGPAAPFLDG